MAKRKGDENSTPAPKKKSSASSQGDLNASRAVFACKRCRTKKIKCDLNYPSCNNCTKRGLTCVGLDPTTGREVPRTYTNHLEDRIAQLEATLRENGLECAKTPVQSSSNPSLATMDGIPATHTSSPHQSTTNVRPLNTGVQIKQEESGPLSLDVHSLLNEGTRSAGSSAPSLYLDSQLGISFARLMYTAVRVNRKGSTRSLTVGPETSKPVGLDSHQLPYSLPNYPSTSPLIPSNHLSLSNILNHEEENDIINSNSRHLTQPAFPPSKTIPEMASSSVIDPSKQDILLAILPPKSTAQEFIKVFFAQLNPQMPILHREEFIRTCFVPIYGPLDQGISLASNYTAINYDQSVPEVLPRDEETWFYAYKAAFERELKKLPDKSKVDAAQISKTIIPPTKFHKPLYFLNMIFAIASSVHHLQYPTTISFAFRTAAVQYVEPVYTLDDPLESLQGILLLALYLIMRPAVPGVWYVLGLAMRVVVDLGLHQENERTLEALNPFVKDKRRRLFWCTYALDRQICFYLGRPVGIADDSVSVPFPLELDDALITPDGRVRDYLLETASGVPTYKVVSLAFFRIRQIQLEVQRILYTKAELPRKYNSLDDWKLQMAHRLAQWKLDAPKTQRTMNSDFNLEFFNLNYNHTVIMLHGILPSNYRLSEVDFQRVLEAAKELIHGYHQLYNSKSINYTWAAVHNLFMAGSLYLYSVYYSAAVRERNLFYEVKKVTQECISALSSLVSRCDAASSCREIFEVLTAAVVKLRYGEIVHGVNGHTHLTNLILTGGHNLNQNLKDLVENMQQEENSIHSINRGPGPARLHLNPFKSPGSEAVLPDVAESAAAAGDFEWVTNPTRQKETGQTGNTDDLDTFFHELENLSPRSFEPAAPKTQVRGPTFDSMDPNTTSTPDGTHLAQSPCVLDYTKLTESTPSTRRQESIRVYELIHEMPTESIWDQFFTAAYNSTLPVLP